MSEDFAPGSPEELRRFAALLRLRAESYGHAAATIRAGLEAGGLLSGGFARPIREEGARLSQELIHEQAHRAALLAEHLERAATRIDEKEVEED